MKVNDLKDGVVFTGKYFPFRIEVISIDEPNNKINVQLTKPSGLSFSVWNEEWDLQVVKWGIEECEYFFTEFSSDYPPLFHPQKAKEPQKIIKAVDMDNKKIVHDGCIITKSGYMFSLLDINPDLIFIEDIAHGLANNCRWNGQSQEFFSVAQHCCMMYDKAPMKDKLMYLFHDAEEYAWGDMIKPLKNIIEAKYPEIIEKMKLLTKVVCDKFNVPYPTSEVKAMDTEMLFWEFENIIKSENTVFWSPQRAKTEFLNRYYYYTEQLDKVVPISDVLEITTLMDKLTDEQRWDIIHTYHYNCGSKNTNCQCNNDD